MRAEIESGLKEKDRRSVADAEHAEGHPVTVIIARVLRPGNEEAFESALKDFIPKSLTFPGHLGVHMLRPSPGGREFGAVLQFRSQETWESFQQWPNYQRFLADVAPYLESSPKVETLCGLESWFTTSGADVLQTPTRWKMAVITWIGVCVTVYVVNSVFSLFAQNWPMLANLLVANAVIVAALTWVVMPVLSWIFGPWLFPAKGHKAIGTNGMN